MVYSPGLCVWICGWCDSECCNAFEIDVLPCVCVVCVGLKNVVNILRTACNPCKSEHRIRGVSVPLADCVGDARMVEFMRIRAIQYISVVDLLFLISYLYSFRHFPFLYY